MIQGEIMGKIGYARVSSVDQNVDRQIDLFEAVGVDRIFVDKISGAKRDRPELNRLLDFVRDGDQVVVESFSRLARSTRDLLSIVDQLRAKNVDLISKKEAVDTTTAQGRFVMTLFGGLSELERETIRERQKEGIDAAKRRGKRLGRPPVERPANWKPVHSDWTAGKITAVEAMKKLGVSKATFYRLVKRE